MPLRFKLIEKCRQDTRNVKADGADFLLEEDSWNDYSYYVMYHLHATGRLTGSGNEYLGYIRIMKEGQKVSVPQLLRHELGENLLFEKLPDGFCSLSTSVELYQSLARRLKVEQRVEFVESMRMILGTDSSYYNAVKDSECFTIAMLRDTSMDNYGLKMGRELLLGKQIYYNLQEQSLKIQFNDVSEPVELHFSCLPDAKEDLIPNGVVAFIGKNGSGKSTAIYKLAKLLYANPDQRFKLKDFVGTITPNDIGLSKLFIISYSPFDNFVLPGIGGEDYRLMLNGMEDCSGRFVFCGIRDVKGEFETLLAESNAETYERLFEKDRVGDTSLKSISQLAVEFSVAMVVIRKDLPRREIWNKIRRQAHSLFPEVEQLLVGANVFKRTDELSSFFVSLSTGYKFFLHSLARVLAYIEKDSLVLFDEPENHIHPPMLSFMMTVMRRILNKYNSVMLVATHSPVVSQEIFAENVYVVRNDGGPKSITHPSIETYGANMSEISSEVFGLTTDITNYYDAYRGLYNQWKTDQWQSVEDMIESFECRLKGKISPQLMSYLINLFYVDSEEARLD